MHKENCTVRLMSERGLNMNMLSTTVVAIDVYHTKQLSSAAPPVLRVDGEVRERVMWRWRLIRTERRELANTGSSISKRRCRVFVLALLGSSSGVALLDRPLEISWQTRPREGRNVTCFFFSFFFLHKQLQNWTWLWEITDGSVVIVCGGGLFSLHACLGINCSFRAVGGGGWFLGKTVTLDSIRAGVFYGWDYFSIVTVIKRWLPIQQMSIR